SFATSLHQPPYPCQLIRTLPQCEPYRQYKCTYSKHPSYSGKAKKFFITSKYRNHKNQYIRNVNHFFPPPIAFSAASRVRNTVLPMSFSLNHSSLVLSI